MKFAFQGCGFSSNCVCFTITYLNFDLFCRLIKIDVLNVKNKYNLYREMYQKLNILHLYKLLFD
jgi:hypothetical protein